MKTTLNAADELIAAFATLIDACTTYAMRQPLYEASGDIAASIEARANAFRAQQIYDTVSPLGRKVHEKYLNYRTSLLEAPVDALTVIAALKALKEGE